MQAKSPLPLGPPCRLRRSLRLVDPYARLPREELFALLNRPRSPARIAVHLEPGANVVSGSPIRPSMTRSVSLGDNRHRTSAPITNPMNSFVAAGSSQRMTATMPLFGSIQVQLPPAPIAKKLLVDAFA
jgi:hypothetical protein